MFEELDDPTPDLRARQTLPSVRARGRTLRRRRQLAVATGAGAAVTLVAAVVLVLPGGVGVTSERLIPAEPPRTAGPTVATPSVLVPSPNGATPTIATPNPAPAPAVPLTPPPVSPAPSPATSSSGPPRPSITVTTPPGARPTSDPAGRQVIQLRGDDLAVTAIGATRTEAVAALTAVLGAPQSDPAADVGCVDAHTEVAWSQFRVGFDVVGRLSGWASTNPAITTPSGIAVGSTVARLEQLYGDRLHLSPSDSEARDTYTVDGVQMLGQLSGTTPSDVVTALRNGDCTGP